MRSCEECGKDFEPARTTARFCSAACRAKASRKPAGSTVRQQREDSKTAGQAKARDHIDISEPDLLKRVDERRGQLSRAQYMRALIMQQSSAGAILAARLPGEKVIPAARVAAPKLPDRSWRCCKHCTHGGGIQVHLDKCTQGCE